MDDVAVRAPEAAEPLGIGICPVCGERITDASDRSEIAGGALRRSGGFGRGHRSLS